MPSPPIFNWSFYPLPLLSVGLALVALALFAGSKALRAGRFWILSATTLALLYLITCSPLDTLAHQFLLVARTAQHLLLVYLLCPLLWATFIAAPRPLPPAGWLHKLLCWWAKPFHAALGFNLALFSWYIPSLNTLSNQHAWIRQLEVLSMIVAGLLLWLPLMPLLQKPDLPFAQQLFYLVMLLAGQIPLFSLLTLSQTALYQIYVQAARLTPLSAYGDQQSAGWLLKLISILLFAGALVRILLQWHSKQRQQDHLENQLAYENLRLVEAARARHRTGAPPQA